MATIFERIAGGEIPCHRIWEDDEHLAFLDINPRVEGHTLVIPKMASEEMYTMDEGAFHRLWDAARKVALMLQQKTGCAKIVTVVVGYEVPHVHIHLLPTNSLADFPFPPVDRPAQGRLAETARKLSG